VRAIPSLRYVRVGWVSSGSVTTGVTSLVNRLCNEAVPAKRFLSGLLAGPRESGRRSAPSESMRWGFHAKGEARLQSFSPFLAAISRLDARFALRSVNAGRGDPADVVFPALAGASRGL
jgi:hypothetical protein